MSSQLPSSGTQLDHIAADLMRTVWPVEFRAAAQQSERLEAFRLRYQAVIERGWMVAADLPGGIECEAVDDVATHVIGWLDGQPVANGRLIFPAQGVRLPIEIEFGIELEPAGQVVQVDRICVARGQSGGSSAVLMALLGACWLQMRSRGYSHLAGIDSASMLRLYRRLGFDHRVLGPAKRYWGIERFPILWVPEQDSDRFFERVQQAGEQAAAPAG